jgi:predicted heme/steroid binding protein
VQGKCPLLDSEMGPVQQRGDDLDTALSELDKGPILLSDDGSTDATTLPRQGGATKTPGVDMRHKVFDPGEDFDLPPPELLGEPEEGGQYLDDKPEAREGKWFNNEEGYLDDEEGGESDRPPFMQGPGRVPPPPSKQAPQPVQKAPAPTQPTSVKQTPATVSGITAAELSKHNSRSDCWVGFQGTAYDITTLLSWHPGGAGTITPYCGTANEFEQAFLGKHGTGKIPMLVARALGKGQLH